jgi:hypothetical protein
MKGTAKKVLDAALKLPEPERVELVEELLAGFAVISSKVVPEGSTNTFAVLTARGYQRLWNDTMFGSDGITSSSTPCRVHRQMELDPREGMTCEEA